MRDKSFERSAEGVEVRVSEGWPRRVVVRHIFNFEMRELILSMQEADGLLYALTAALEDAKHRDRKMGE